MLNYQVDPALLIPLVPSGTELDSFEGNTYMSLLAFRFCRTKLLGKFPIPFHTDFDEINLRFYVRRRMNGEIRRGVVFVAELVPKQAIATIARMVYGENYRRASIWHGAEVGESRRTFVYSWRVHTDSCHISVETEGLPCRPNARTLEEFITEHYWGYTPRPSRGCVEYRVAHEPWRVWRAGKASFEGDSSSYYGSDFNAVLQRPPDSAFVAEGSAVTVFRGNRIRGDGK